MKIRPTQGFVVAGVVSCVAFTVHLPAAAVDEVPGGTASARVVFRIPGDDAGSAR